MDENTLKARIVADVSGLKKGMLEGAQSIDHLTDAEKRAVVAAKKLEQHNRNVSRSYAGLSKSTGASTVVFQEFNRVIQDAPYGMMGVGNNLQQLASNFGALTTKSGGTGNAIKTALKSMTVGLNPAILAVTVLTTAWTYFERGAFDSENAVKSFSDTLDEFKKSLDNVSAATLEGASNAEKETQKFSLLRAQAENVNVSMEDRLEAVRDLQKEFPDYLGNLTKEQILTGKVGGAYEELTKSIIATAKARAYSDAIAKNSIEILTIEERTTQRVNDILGKRLEIEKANAKVKELEGKAGETNRIEREQNIGKVLRLEQEISGLVKEQVDDVTKVNSINTENLKLEENITTQIEKGARFTKNLKEETEGANAAFKAFSKAMDESNKKFFAEGKAAYDAYQAQLDEAIATQKKFEQLVKAVQAEGVDPMDKVQADLAKDFPKNQPIKDEAEVYDPTAELKAIEKQARLTEAAFDGLGQAVSMAFGGSPEWGKFLSSFIKFAGEVIASNFAISKSNIIAGSTATGAAAGPAAAFVTPGLITAGLALIGSLFGAIKGGSGSGGSSFGGGGSKTYGIPGREKGGRVQAGQPYIVGEKRMELFVPDRPGTIIPRIGDYSSNTGSAHSSISRVELEIDLAGSLYGEDIRITGKRAERRVNKT